MQKFGKAAITISVAIVILLFVICSHSNPLSATENRFPEFRYKTINGVPFTDKNILDKIKKNVFIRLSVHCASCDFTMNELLRNGRDLGDISFFLIVHHSDSSGLKDFINKHSAVKDLKNFTFLLDPEPLDSMTVFKSYYVPSFFIYTNKQLLKKMTGNITKDSIRAAFRMNSNILNTFK